MAGKRYPDSPFGAATHVFAIAPHDSNAIDPIPRQVRFDADGAVTLRCVDSAADVTINVVAGEVLDWQVKYIRDTGTDAIAIHGAA